MLEGLHRFLGAEPQLSLEEVYIPDNMDELEPDVDIPPDEGDDGHLHLLAADPVPHIAEPRMAPRPANLRRVLRKGMHGPDVLAVERALVKGHFRKHRASRVFGRRCRKNVKAFQRHAHLQVDGVVGQQTWQALVRHQLVDGYGHWLMAHAKKPKPKTLNRRDELVRFAFFYLAHAGSVHYLQQRPMQHLVCLPYLNEYCDCSEWATNDYKCAGIPDPNGNHYDGIGNTDTLAAHGHYTPNPQPGDLIFYSWPSHVVVYVGSGRTISQGSEGGPYLVWWNYRPITHIRSYI